MCNTLVPVDVPEIVRVPYGSGSGRTRWKYGLGKVHTVMLRCSHAMTDDDFERGYDLVDEFGRRILCPEHREPEGAV